MLDLKITGARLIDGTGAPARRADLGIAADRIEAVGDLSSAEAHAVIDASGRVVCPGLIDAHSHSDAYLLIEPSAPSKIAQGVTTEIVGNCGASAAPITGAYRLPSDWRDQSYPGTWRTMKEYRALLEQVRPAVNVVPLVGHGALRAGVLGYENRPATPAEQAAMGRLLQASLDEGGRGLSSGLIYPPGMFASTEELIALARIVARYDGVYTSHIRGEGQQLLSSLEEAVVIGRGAGVRVEVSHLKTQGRAAWPLAERAIEMLTAAREAGVRVAADRYPYTASCTSLDVLLPAWAQEGGNEAILERLRDPSTRARIRAELTEGRLGETWEAITVGSTAHADNRPFQGLPLLEAARRLDLAPADALLSIVEKDALRTEAFFFSMSAANLFRFLAEPWVSIGSDASLRATSGPLSEGHPHPRAFGAFARFLRLALEGQTVPVEEAVRKMTSLPADHFGLADRGRLERGRRADAVVFDPARLRDTADYAAPKRLPTGIEQVVVNGVLTLSDGQLTGRRAGHVL